MKTKLEADHQHEEEAQMNGDVLETILSHVPLIDLVSASHVSKPWRAAVSSSLRHHNPAKPWLILRTQATRFPHATTTRAYDPRSNIWIKISQPSIEFISPLKSSHSNFLYMLSPSKFTFSSDALNSNWRHVTPPLIWRRDPIVARVGVNVIVAGGACDFEDDPLAVEMYNLKTRVWSACESMPGNLKDSAASQWLSVATTDEKLITVDKRTGVTHWFDPETKSWSEPFVLNENQPVSISSYNIGCSDNRLILVGACRTESNVERVKIWRFVDGDDCEEIGEMPIEYVAKLKSRCFGNLSIDIRVAGNVLYVYNTEEAEVVVVCEMIGGGCRWWSVGNVVAREEMMLGRVVFSCAEVGVKELERAMVMENWRFEERSTS